MSTRRRAFLNLVFIALIGGSTYDIVRDQEHWPFSQYPMFRGVWSSPTFTWFRLFGVTAGGHEFPLEQNGYVLPFDQSRLSKAIGRILETPGRAERLGEALDDFLLRYHELAAEGEHSGPPLVALRLYELEWTIDPAARNVDHPEHRRFIAEVRRP
jgi:hypothetical protein